MNSTATGKVDLHLPADEIGENVSAIRLIRNPGQAKGPATS